MVVIKDSKQELSLKVIHAFIRKIKHLLLTLMNVMKCNQKFTFKTCLDRHIKRHLNIRNFKCDYKGPVFSGRHLPSTERTRLGSVQ
jgi:hypothetical protein